MNTNAHERASLAAQRQEVVRYLRGEGGRRASEAAMEVAAMSRAKLRKLYRAIVTLINLGALVTDHSGPTVVYRHRRGLK